MAKIATYASKKNILEKPIYGTQVLTMGHENPLVPGNGPVLSEFSAVNTALREINDEINVLREQLRSRQSERKARVAEWTQKLNRVASFTFSACKGDPAAIESAGFYVVPTAQPPQPLDAPIDVLVRTNGSPGVSKISWKPVPDAKSYLIQCSTDPDDPESWGPSVPCTKASHTMHGAEPGKVCWFRVCAVNAKGQGPWSEPARRPVM